MGNRGGKRPGAGRPRTKPNRSTVTAAEIAKAEIEQARAEGRVLAKDRLEKYLDVCEGAMSIFRPNQDGTIAPGSVQNWDRFAEWMDKSIYCAKELAKYQSAQYRAIAAMSAPTTGGGPRPGDDAKVIDLKKNPIALEAAYKRMLAPARR